MNNHWNLTFVRGFALLVLLACDNRIVERVGKDYLPYETGNWWRYVNAQAPVPETVYVEVESLTTITNRECYPVTFSGEVRYYSIDHNSFDEYRRITCYHAGDVYDVVQGFVTRVPLPMIQGNVYRDSIFDSVNVAGEYIKGKFWIEGQIAGYETDDTYGSVYKVVLSSTETVIQPETTITLTNYREEYYAPDIGLIKFTDTNGSFLVSEFLIQ